MDTGRRHSSHLHGQRRAVAADPPLHHPAPGPLEFVVEPEENFR